MSAKAHVTVEDLREVLMTFESEEGINTMFSRDKRECLYFVPESRPILARLAEIFNRRLNHRRVKFPQNAHENVPGSYLSAKVNQHKVQPPLFSDDPLYLRSGS